MKFHFCKNDCNEVTPAISFISGYFMPAVIRDLPDIELKKNNFERNEISCKQPLCS